MILTRMLVKNWGCFRDETEIEFTPGLNLIHGRNEAGKSTLVDALTKAFFDKHTTGGNDMKIIQPWGSALPPEVHVEFTTAEERFLIHKRFLGSPLSEFRKMVNGSWQRIAEGDEADKMVVEVLGGSLTGRGISKSKHWGIAQALWSRQGEILPGDGFSKAARDRVQAVLGDMVPSTRGKGITGKIEELFNDHWTPKNRNPKKGSELDSIKKEIEETEEDVDQLKGVLAETENLRLEVSDLRIELEDLRDSMAKAEKRYEESKEKAKEAKEHRDERKEIERRVERLTSDYNELNDRIGKISKTEGLIKKRREREKELDKDITKKTEKKEDLEVKIKKFRKTIGNLEKEREKKREEQENINGAERAINGRRDLEKIEEKLEDLRELNSDREDLEKSLDDLVAPTTKELKGIGELSRDLEEARTRLDAIGMKAIVSARADIEGSILLDDNEQDLSVPQEGEEEWKAGQKIEIDLPDIVNIRISSGSEDVKELQGKLEKKKDTFDRKTAKFSTGNISELRALRDRKRELRSQLDSLNLRIEDRAPSPRISFEDVNGVCPYCGNDHRKGDPYVRKGDFENHVSSCQEGEEPLHMLERRSREETRRIEELWESIPEDSLLHEYRGSDDLDRAKGKISKRKRALKAAIDDIKEDLRDKRREKERLMGEKGTSAEEIGELREERADIKGSLRDRERELENLRDDGMDAGERKKKLRDLATELERKKMALEGFEDEKESIEELPLKELEQAKREKEGFREDIFGKESKIAGKEGELRNRIKADTFTKLTKAEEKLEVLISRRERVRRRTEAIMLLYDLNQYNHERTMEEVLEPLKKRVTRSIGQITNKYEDIDFDCEAGLKPTELKPRGWNARAAVATLSHGTREQVAFSVRLALGEILSKDEAQLVILDDPLTNTDKPRLRRALGVLEGCARGLQIILITCDKTKYGGLGEMRVIEME